jgi:hypothetical protein
MLARFDRKPLKQPGVKIRRGISVIDLDPLFEQIAGSGAIGSIVGTHDIFQPADAEKGKAGRPFSNRRPQNQIFQRSGPSIPAGIQLEYPLGRAEISRLQSAFRPVIPWAL